MESVSAVTATPSVELGTERVVAGEKYVYIYNAGASAAAPLGMIRPTSATGAYTCAVSSVSGDMPVAFVKHVTIPSGSYGWGLVKGMLTISVASSASDQAAGPKAVGANGIIVTNTAGYYLIGDLVSAVVSGNSLAMLISL
jgi:hypothetical protein